MTMIFLLINFINIILIKKQNKKMCRIDEIRNLEKKTKDELIDIIIKMEEEKSFNNKLNNVKLNFLHSVFFDDEEE